MLPALVNRDGLTADQAKEFLTIVLKHEYYQLDKKGMDIDSPFKVDPAIPSERGFWEFGLIFDSPASGATEVLGRYAVSRFTGDVWETNLCKHYQTADLMKAQKILMQQTQKSFSDEAEARQGLGCASQ